MSYQTEHIVFKAIEDKNISLLRSLPLSELLVKDCDNETALHWAATNGELEMCKYLLLKCPSLINMIDDDGLTAYDHAFRYSSDLPTITHLSMV